MGGAKCQKQINNNEYAWGEREYAKGRDQTGAKGRVNSGKGS